MIANGGHEIVDLLNKHGGADGYWGDATESAFEKMGVPIRELIRLARA